MERLEPRAASCDCESCGAGLSGQPGAAMTTDAHALTAYQTSPSHEEAARRATPTISARVAVDSRVPQQRRDASTARDPVVTSGEPRLLRKPRAVCGRRRGRDHARVAGSTMGVACQGPQLQFQLQYVRVRVSTLRPAQRADRQKRTVTDHHNLVGATFRFGEPTSTTKVTSSRGAATA